MTVFNFRTLLWSLALASLLLAAQVRQAAADITGTWTTAATTASTNIRGITVSYSGDPGGGAYANDTFATDPSSVYWNTPYSGAVPSGTSLLATVAPASRTITVSFSEPVDNPVLHIDRIGGASGTAANTSVWNLTGSVSTGGSVTLTRRSGNTQFLASGTSFQRSTTLASDGTTGTCTTPATTGTGCGSVQYNGTGITQLTFNVVGAGPSGNDALEFRWSFVGSNIIVRKQSIGGTSTFNFTGSASSGAGTFALNTATTNPISSATFAVADHSLPITITETAATGFTLTQATCFDQASLTVASSLAGQVLTIAAGSYRANQTITCTFVNTQQQQLNLAKVWNNAVAGHTISATTSGGAANATVNSTAPTGTTGAAATMLAGNSVTLPAETFGGGAVAANYTSTVACTGGTTLASSTPPQTITIGSSATATTCTYTNSRIGQQLNLAKSWVNSRSGDNVSVTTTGGTANPTLNSTAPTITNGVAVTVYAGDVVTLPAETFTGGPNVTTLYTSTVACTGGTTLASGATGRTITVTNSATATTCTYTNMRLQAALTTVKTRTSPNPALTGSTVTFQIVVTNNGPAAASNVALTDQVPAGLTFVSATPGQGSYVSGTGVWTIGSLANGASATLTLNATIN